MGSPMYRRSDADHADDDNGIFTYQYNSRQFDESYRIRLKIGPADSLPPDNTTLARLVEAHLRYIPFENLSIHGCRDDDSSNDNAQPAVPLTLLLLANKILHRNRGGCCFELNGLLGHYLLQLGYPVVKLVPCWVYAGPERGHSKSHKAKFRTRQTHMFLLVRTCRGDSFVTDVGLGEPPLHPLKYGRDILNMEQITPEGMRSRIVREEFDWVGGNGRVRKCLRLEWWRPCRRCYLCGGTKKNGIGAAKIRTLRLEAEKLRIKADKARRRSRAKPRPSFKVFASCPSVRDDAECQLLLQRKRDDINIDSNDNTAIPTSIAAADIRQQICNMWAALSDGERILYKEKALAELEAIKVEAKKAEDMAVRAEALVKESTTKIEMKDDKSHDYPECDELCDGVGGYWEPRLQWDVADAPLGPIEKEVSFPEDRPLESFAEAANVIAGKGSTFVRKIVACILTRTEKITLSGNSLRITSPRFPPQIIDCSEYGKAAGWPVQSCMELGSREDVRSALKERFDIELEESKGLNMDISAAATSNGCRLWDHL